MDFSLYPTLDTLFNKLSRGQCFGVCLAIIAMIGLADHYTGFELSFSIFYLIPVAATSWYNTKKTSILICVISALVWVGIDLQGGHHYSNLLIPVWNTLVRLGFFLIVSSLLSRIKTHLAREEALSRTDVLTGINNARAFREWLNHYLSISARQQQPIALGYIDLDNFKHVNDSQGHSTGDEVIKSIGRMLGTSVRTTDIVGRIGGDEFGIILPNANSKDTQTVFSKLHEKLTTEMTKSGWPIGVSIGGAIFITPPSSADEALKAADALMYDVKKSGKNQIRIKEFT